MAIPEPIEFRRTRQVVRPDPSGKCAYAEEFGRFCDALLVRLGEVTPANAEVGFAQAKLQLLDRYCDFLTDTPVHHRRRKHTCLTEVLNATIREIRCRQREALPPKLAVPPRRPRAAPGTAEGEPASLLDVLNALGSMEGGER